MSETYRIFGSELSPYSVKVRSYFRYKKIPHEWIIRDSTNQDEFQRHAKLPLVPLVVASGGEVFQDSTPIIEHFENLYPEPSLVPVDPTLAFLSALIEEYADAFDLRAAVNRCGVIAGPWQMGKVDQGVFTHWMLAHHFGNPLSYIGFGGAGKQVRDLLHGKQTFGELIDSPERIPTNLLTDRLRRLEEAGIVERSVYQERPVRHTYGLTPKGEALGEVLLAMVKWGKKYVPGAKVLKAPRRNAGSGLKP